MSRTTVETFIEAIKKEGIAGANTKDRVSDAIQNVLNIIPDPATGEGEAVNKYITQKVWTDKNKELAGNYHTIEKTYINKIGGEVYSTVSISKATPLVAFDRAQGLELKDVFDNPSQSACAFYDKGGIFISVFNTSISGVQNLNIPVGSIPESAVYFRSTALMANDPRVVFSLADEFASRQVDLSILKDLLSYGIFSIEGKYINKNTGMEVVGSGLKCTMFLPCVEDQIIPLIGTVASTEVANCVFYDENKKYISSFSGAVVSCKAPQNGFYRLSATIKNVTKTTPSVFAVINEVYRQNCTLYNLFTESGYINGNSGNIGISADFKATKYIPIINGLIYTLVDVYDNQTATPSVGFYTKDKVFISRIAVPVALGKQTVILDSSNIPSNAAYFRATAKVTDKAYVEAPYMAILMNVIANGIDGMSNYVLKEVGKGLSSNDYTYSDKTKVEKIVTNGDGTKVLTDDGSYKQLDETGGVVPEAIKYDNSAVHSISASPIGIPRPFVCITIDDGKMSDYTLLKPIMEAYSIPMTFYIHDNEKGTPGVDRLSDEQILEFHSLGCEFGSHTGKHNTLSRLTIHKSIALGDTTIEFYNANSEMYTHIPKSGEYKFYVGSDAKNVFTATEIEKQGNYMVFTLDKPSNVAITAPIEAWMHEDTALEEMLYPKTRLENLGIPCNGIAYPYGGLVPELESIVKQHFSYGRGARASSAGTFSGAFDRDDYHYNQFMIPCTELINLSNEEVDALIQECIDRNSVLCVLGHSISGPVLVNALNSFIQKVKDNGIEIVTLNEALKYHSNAATLGTTIINRNGLMSGNGVTFLPRRTATATSSLDSFPVGISIMRVNSTDNGGFPTAAGILETIRTNTFYKGYWTVQYYYDLNSNDIFYRQTIAFTQYRGWSKINMTTV